MHFGENQLSRSLIGLSPLPTTHPLSLQPKWVRASTTSYCCFTLAMGRSLRFASRTHHYTNSHESDTPSSDSLSLRLPLPVYSRDMSLTHSLILQKARHHPPP